LIDVREQFAGEGPVEATEDLRGVIKVERLAARPAVSLGSPARFEPHSS
jgi:hypothetical protein